MASATFLPIWTAMMAAMMLPSTVPLLRLDHAAARSRTRLIAIAAGYLLVWVAIGALVLPLDLLLGGRLLGMHGRGLTVALLAMAAVYQLLPVKQRCLVRCRAPLARMLHGWRDGLVGALRMGMENGVWCAGCCIGLMTALFGLGVMSVGWMAVVGAVVFLEKGTAVGARASRFVSGLLVVAAMAWAL
jgi:predicted metal-binding membrane protein